MRIMDLGNDTFLVGRKVIQASVPGMFDLLKQPDRDELVRISENLYKAKYSRAQYGDLTVCVLSPYVERQGTAKYTQWQKHFRDLPEGAKEILRKEFPEHADKI